MKLQQLIREIKIPDINPQKLAKLCMSLDDKHFDLIDNIFRRATGKPYYSTLTYIESIISQIPNNGRVLLQQELMRIDGHDLNEYTFDDHITPKTIISLAREKIQQNVRFNDIEGIMRQYGWGIQTMPKFLEKLSTKELQELYNDIESLS